MNMFLCLAITFLLAGLMFIYVRNQMTALESQVLKLTEVVRSVAERDTEKPEIQEEAPEPPKLKKCYVSDDSDSDSDSEEEVEEEPVHHIDITQDVKVIPMQIPLQMNAFEINFSEPSFKTPMETVELIKTEEIVEKVEPKLEMLSMKELKELAAQKGGTSALKTKKALLEFLSS
jgi:hypothetical protein